MYTPLQRFLHQTVACLIVVMLPLGLLLPHLNEGFLAAVLYEVQKSLGIRVFLLMGMRLFIRLYRGAPPDPVMIDPMLYRLAKWGHWGLYALILAVPLLGYAATTMCCAPVLLFGLVPVPLSLVGSEDVVKQLFKAHQWAAWLLGVTALGHIVMAFWHRHQQDGVFNRMWPDQGASGEKGGAA